MEKGPVMEGTEDNGLPANATTSSMASYWKRVSEKHSITVEIEETSKSVVKGFGLFQALWKHSALLKTTDLLKYGCLKTH